MPRNTVTPRSLEDQAQVEVEDELDELISAIAAEDGLAKGATHLSPDQEVELWGQLDPLVDYDTLKQQLMTGTVPPELYDPTSDRRLALLRINEDLAEEWAGRFAETAEQPLDEEMASLYAQLAEYPGRSAVLAPYEDDTPEAQLRKVAKARSVDARWRRRQGQAEPTDVMAAPAEMPAEGGY